MGFSVFKARICGFSRGFAGYCRVFAALSVEFGIAILCGLLVKIRDKKSSHLLDLARLCDNLQRIKIMKMHYTLLEMSRY
jgi:hypothetical protein